MNDPNKLKNIHPSKFFHECISRNIRPDGRLFSNYRPVIVNVNSIKTADGSALVKIGRTTVVCGIKAEFAQPKPETPNKGYLIPNVELPPLCSPKFKPGPPSDVAQITTLFLADVLKNSECVNLEDLCIAKDKLVWCLYADIVCLNHDGSLIDACLLALTAALLTVKLPAVEYDATLDNKVVNEDDFKPLKVYHKPVSTSYIIFENNLITDPTSEEEELSMGLITIVMSDDKLCSVHKPGGCPIAEEKIYKAIKETTGHAVELNKLIAAAIESNET